MIANRLLALLDKVRPNGKNQWMACCPAHDDRNPSLSIKEGQDGRVLVHCFAGCGASDVLGAVGMELRDLMPEGPLDHFKRPAGWAERERRLKDAAYEQARRDFMFLDICDGARKAGERLSRETMQREADAWRRTR